MRKLCKGIHIFIGIIRSLFFNIRILPLKKAIKLPVIISPFVKLTSLDGKIMIKTSNVEFGMIKIGYGEVGIFDRIFSRTILQIEGELIFLGKANIGHGSKISVGNNGKLIIGKNFKITAETASLADLDGLGPQTPGRGNLVAPEQTQNQRQQGMNAAQQIQKAPGHAAGDH